MVRKRTASLLVVAAACMCGNVEAQGASAPADELRGRVEGRVLGPLGEPMVACEVWAALWPQLDDVIARTRTDGDGYYVLSKLPLRSISVFATAAGHTVGHGSASLSPDRQVDGENLRLWPASGVRGRVLDADGEPVADAIVLGTRDYTWFDGRFRSPETHTDAEGRFELTGIPIGDQVLRVWKQGYVMSEHGLSSTEDAELDVRLVRGDGVTLRVQAKGLSADQAPGVRVRMYPTRDGSGFAFPRELENGHLDGHARWTLKGLPNCEWYVELGSSDFAFEPRSVRLKPGDAVHEIEFVATPHGALKLRGALRSSDGTPLAGETLLCRTQRSASMNGGRPGTCTTDSNGRFELDAPLVDGERYSLHLVGSQFVLQQQKGDEHTGRYDARYLVRYEDVAEADRELDLVAARAVFPRGRAVDRDGQPVPFRWCELQVLRNGQWSQMAYTTSRRDGSIEFPGVHDLGTDLRIEISGQTGAALSEPFSCDSDSIVDVTVPRPGRIVGRVLDDAGSHMPATRLMIQHYDVESGEQLYGGSWTNVLSDAAGRYAFVGVAPVGHKISVMRGDDRVFTTEIVGVGEGEEKRFDVRVPADAGR